MFKNPLRKINLYNKVLLCSEIFSERDECVTQAASEAGDKCVQVPGPCVLPPFPRDRCPDLQSRGAPHSRTLNLTHTFIRQPTGTVAPPPPTGSDHPRVPASLLFG